MQPQDPPKADSLPQLVEKGVRASKSFTYYGITISKSGVLPQSLALKIILQDGSQQAINYHEFISPLKFNGKTEIELQTSSIKVKIIGNHLEKLFDYILENAVVWIENKGESINIYDIKGSSIIYEISILENI